MCDKCVNKCVNKSVNKSVNRLLIALKNFLLGNKKQKTLVDKKNF